VFVGVFDEPGKVLGHVFKGLEGHRCDDRPVFSEVYPRLGLQPAISVF